MLVMILIQINTPKKNLRNRESYQERKFPKSAFGQGCLRRAKVLILAYSLPDHFHPIIIPFKKKFATIFKAPHCKEIPFGPVIIIYAGVVFVKKILLAEPLL